MKPPAAGPVAANQSVTSDDPNEQRAIERRAKEEADKNAAAEQEVERQIAEQKALAKEEADKAKARERIDEAVNGVRSVGRGYIVAAGLFKKLAEACEGMARGAEGAVSDAHSLKRSDPARGLEFLYKFIQESKSSGLWADKHFKLAIPLIEEAERTANAAYQAERAAARKESEKHQAALKAQADKQAPNA